jgi:phosphatidylglycerophosphate synthase
LFFYIYLLELRFIAITLIIIIALSDIIDGQLAKKLEVTSTSPLEAYIDAVADFVFVTIAFSAFSITGIYPAWIPLVLVIMFLFLYSHQIPNALFMIQLENIMEHSLLQLLGLRSSFQ